MKSNALLAVFVVLVSLVGSATVLAQRNELDRMSVLRDDVVRVGVPLPEDDDENDDEGNDEASDCQANLLPVPRTGQTGCWDGSGNPIGCAGTGQDGEYQYGASVSPRFTDNGDGTVTDNLTGLIWLQDANCFENRDWASALSAANTLASASDACTPDLTDGSVAGDWRLPNARELASLADYGQGVPALPTGYPFSGLPIGNALYWSSTTYFLNPTMAWFVSADSGDVNEGAHKQFTLSVWPVRGGQ